MKRARGFTLIELMIVVAVVAILAAIAIPAFNDQMRRSRRAQAIQGLQEMQLAQERFRADNPTYNAGLTRPNTDYYSFQTTAAGAASYTLQATAIGAQAGDSECPVMTLTFNAGETTRTPSPATTRCWN